MNRYIVVLSVLCLATMVGCESMGEGTKKGAGIGAVTGAAIGGIVGHQDGHGWEGALIGGAAGATAGGLIGNQMDKASAQGQGDYLSITQIVTMAKDGVPDDVIIDEIDRTKSKYNLTSETITYLKNNGVGDKVIDVMLGKPRG